MDSARALSNSASRAAAPGSLRPAAPGRDPFADWQQSLAEFAAALRAYAREVGEAGSRAFGARWAAALRAIAPAELPPVDRSAVGGKALAARMAEGDTLEATARHIGDAARILLSPDAQAAVAAGMSRTFSENLQGLRRGATEAAAAAAAAARAALAAAAGSGGALAAGLSAAAIAEAYARPGEGDTAPRGAVATELYVGALACLRTPRARALLGASREGVLGGDADTRAAAAADAATLAEYHPCQAMCYVPAFGAARQSGYGRGDKDTNPEPRGEARGSGPGGEDATPSRVPVDLSFPRARLAVSYDLAPLVERRRALEYGPLASTTSGLSYRTVERLRTIRAARVLSGAPGEPPVRPDPAGAGREGLVEGPILVSTAPGMVWAFGPPSGPGADSGRTRSTQGPETPGTPGPEAPGGGMWAPFAGSRPGVGLYAAAAAAVILEELRAEREAGWGAELLARYEAAARDGSLPDPPANPDVLVDALTAEFEKAYDAAPPEDLPAYRALVVPPAPGPRDYISAAVARLTGDALDARLRAHLAEPRPRVPYAAFEREARISQAVLAADLSRGLWRRLREAYWGDSEAFVPHPVRRKVLLVRHFRRLAAAAAAEPVYAAPPSLKSWAAGAPR